MSLLHPRKFNSEFPLKNDGTGRRKNLSFWVKTAYFSGGFSGLKNFTFRRCSRSPQVKAGSGLTECRDNLPHFVLVGSQQQNLWRNFKETYLVEDLWWKLSSRKIYQGNHFKEIYLDPRIYPTFGDICHRTDSYKSLGLKLSFLKTASFPYIELVGEGKVPLNDGLFNFYITKSMFMKQTKISKHKHIQRLFHQPRFPWNKGISLTKPAFGVRSREVAIIWPERCKQPIWFITNWGHNALVAFFCFFAIKRIKHMFLSLDNA